MSAERQMWPVGVPLPPQPDDGSTLPEDDYDRLGERIGLTPDEAETVSDDRSTPQLATRLIGAAEFILDGPDQYEAVWGTRDQVAWAEGEATWLCGPQGVAKSTLMQQLALHRHGILDGDLLGMPVPVTAGRGLYLAMDRPNQIKRSMRRMVHEEHRHALADRLVIWKGPPPCDLAKHTDTLIGLALQADADTIYVDSLKDAAVGLSEDEVGAGLNRAVQTALAAGIEVVGCHHQRKAQQGGTKPKTLDDVYGSTWITSGAGSVILLWGKAGDAAIELEHLKSPSEPVGPHRLLIDFASGTVAIENEVDLHVLAARTANGLTAEGAARALFRVTEPDRNQIQKARRRLDRDPRLDRHEGPKPAGGGKPPTLYRAITQQSRTPLELVQSPDPAGNHESAL